MESNLNPHRESVFLELTPEQAVMLREELEARRRHHSARAGYLTNLGDSFSREIALDRGECVEVLASKVGAAQEAAAEWLNEGGDRITVETDEMRFKGRRLAGAYIGEAAAEELESRHLVVVAGIDWLRLWAALRNKMCGRVLVNDEEYAPHSGAEPCIALVFPVRLRDLMRRIARAFGSKDPKGDEVVFLSERNSLYRLERALVRAIKSERGKVGYYRSRFTKNPAKASKAELEVAHLEVLLASVDGALSQPYAVPKLEGDQTKENDGG